MPVCPKCGRGRLAVGRVELAPANGPAREQVQKSGRANQIPFGWCRDCGYRDLDLKRGDIVRAKTSFAQWRVTEVVTDG